MLYKRADIFSAEGVVPSIESRPEGESKEMVQASEMDREHVRVIAAAAVDSFLYENNAFTGRGDDSGLVRQLGELNTQARSAQRKLERSLGIRSDAGQVSMISESGKTVSTKNTESEGSLAAATSSRKKHKGETSIRTQERVREYRDDARERERHLCSVKDLGLARIRSGVRSSEVRVLIERLRKGDTAGLPNGLLVADEKTGETMVDAGVLEKLPASQGNAQINTLRRLWVAADTIATIDKKPSIQKQEFLAHREAVFQTTAQDRRRVMTRWQDYTEELATDTAHSFATPETREAYREVEEYLQDMVDRLFDAVGLNGKYLPRVRLTRSSTVNAFVFRADAGQVYENVSTEGQEPEELPIFVHVGLVEEFKKPEQLAGILAHEFSHLLQPQYTRTTTSEDSQRLEYDADVTGMRMMNDAGFNPNAMIQVMKHLQSLGHGLDKLSVIVGGTHPDTGKRVIELQKELNRTDSLYTNAGKPTGVIPGQMASALEVIKESRVSSETLDFARDTLPVAAEKWRTQGADHRITMQEGVHKHVNSYVREELYKAYLLQELAHGTMGYRDELLQSMSIMGALALAKKNAELPIFLYIKDQKSHYVSGDVAELSDVSVSNDFLPPADDPKKYMRKKEENETVQSLMDAQWKMVVEEIGAAHAESASRLQQFWPVPAKLEEWLTSDREDIVAFWSSVSGWDGQQSPVMTPEEKLRFIAYYLCNKDTSSGIGFCSGSFGATLSIPENYEYEVAVPVDVPRTTARDDYLSHLPLSLRAQRVAQDPGPPPQFRMEKRNATKGVERNFRFGTSIPMMNFDVWESVAEDHPVLAQEMSAAVTSAMIEAYRKVLENEGIQAPDLNAMRFILKKCSRIESEAFFDDTIPATFGSVAEIYRLLSAKSFATLFHMGYEGGPKHRQGAEGERGQRKLLEECRFLLAFAFIPQTDEEKKVSAECLQHIEMLQKDTMATSINMVFAGRDAQALQIVPSVHTKYVTVWQNHGEGSGLTLEVPSGSAASERLWRQFGGDILQTVDIREEDRQIAASSDVLKPVQDIAARYIAAYRHYRKQVYEDGLSTTQELLTSFRHESHGAFYGADNYSSQLPTFAEPLLDQAVDDIMGQSLFRVMSAMGRKNAPKPEAVRMALKNAIRQSVESNPLEELAFLSTLETVGTVGDKQGADEARSRRLKKYTEIVPVALIMNRPRGVINEEKYDKMGVPADVIVEHLRELAIQRSSAAKLLALLEAWPAQEKEKNTNLRMVSTLQRLLTGIDKGGIEATENFVRLLAVGQLVNFSEGEKYLLPVTPESVRTNDAKNRQYVRNMIDLYRVSAETYQTEWENAEQFKKIDMQLSAWEWVYDNPFLDFAAKPNEVGVHDLQRCIKMDVLKKRFQIDQKDLTPAAGHFSWPLFFQEVWDDPAECEKRLQLFTTTDAEKRDIADIIPRIYATLERIVSDGSNIDTVKGMQPGFFREFILFEKMQRMGVATLEEMEAYLPYFTQSSHEGVARNQVSGLVEENAGDIYTEIKPHQGSHEKFEKRRSKQESARARRDALLQTGLERNATLQALSKELFALNNYDGIMPKLVVTAKASNDMGTYNSAYDRTIDSRAALLVLQIQNIQQLAEKRVRSRLSAEQIAAVEEDPNNWDIKWNLIHTPAKVDEQEIEAIIRLAADEVYRWYEEHLTREEVLATREILCNESDVFVFSDHVIESKRSKLEIGPAYRERMVSQPLMDWHVQALAAATSVAEAATCLARVEEMLPQKHPLRDMFVRNQLSAEVWHMAVAALGTEKLAELGVSLRTKHIDLADTLKKFPLHADISFVKQYDLIELDGMDAAVRAMDSKSARAIIVRVERTLNTEISPDAHPALRRLLVSLEAKVVWPQWREARDNGDKTVFQSCLDRVTTLYPEPTIERDDLLESIGMDVARTPDEIRRVWSLRYAEAVRWPDQDKSNEKAVATQFTAFEKLRFMASTLDTKDRANYLIHILGGVDLLENTLALGRTGIDTTERRDVFWHLTVSERRTILYDLLNGGNGVFEKSYVSGVSDAVIIPTKSGCNISYEFLKDNDGMVRYVVDGIFDQILPQEKTEKEQGVQSQEQEAKKTTNTGILDASSRKLMGTIFRELFVQQPDSTRRTELLLGIIDSFGTAKQEGRELSAGEVIRLMLEQMGVVGIKAGQVLSEIPDLLPEDIRKELSRLKDSVPSFSKRPVLSYINGADLGSSVSEIGGVVGSASVKQVQEVLLTDGTVAVAKAKRPSIDKHFDADVDTLRKVLDVVQKDHNVPAYLVDEIVRVVADELHFDREVSNHQAVDTMLKERDAQLSVTIAGKNTELPLSVATPLATPEIIHGETADSGIIIEEYVRGLSLKHVIEYRVALQSGAQAAAVEDFRIRMTKQYGHERVADIEQTVQNIDTDSLQASLGLELLRQIQSGVFHADLHTGNFYLDFSDRNESVRGVFIDLGSVGYSNTTRMPDYRNKPEVEKTYAADFRQFLTALFAPQMDVGGIAEIVNKHTSLTWDVAEVERVMVSKPVSEKGGAVQEDGTDGKIKRLFYAILDAGGGASMDTEFRYFLKAVTTASGHFDKLRVAVANELQSMMSGDAPITSYLSTIAGEGLLDMSKMF